MVAPFVNLQVSAAGQRRLDLHSDFASTQGPDAHFLDPYIFFAMQDGCFHRAGYGAIGPEAKVKCICPLRRRVWLKVGDKWSNLSLTLFTTKHTRPPKSHRIYNP